MALQQVYIPHSLIAQHSHHFLVVSNEKSNHSRRLVFDITARLLSRFLWDHDNTVQRLIRDIAIIRQIDDLPLSMPQVTLTDAISSRLSFVGREDVFTVTCRWPNEVAV